MWQILSRRMCVIRELLLQLAEGTLRFKVGHVSHIPHSLQLGTASGPKLIQHVAAHEKRKCSDNQKLLSHFVLNLASLWPLGWGRGETS